MTPTRGSIELQLTACLKWDSNSVRSWKHSSIWRSKGIIHPWERSTELLIFSTETLAKVASDRKIHSSSKSTTKTMQDPVLAQGPLFWNYRCLKLQQPIRSLLAWLRKSRSQRSSRLASKRLYSLCAKSLWRIRLRWRKKSKCKAKGRDKALIFIWRFLRRKKNKLQNSQRRRMSVWRWIFVKAVLAMLMHGETTDMASSASILKHSISRVQLYSPNNFVFQRLSAAQITLWALPKTAESTNGANIISIVKREARSDVELRHSRSLSRAS